MTDIFQMAIVVASIFTLAIATPLAVRFCFNIFS